MTPFQEIYDNLKSKIITYEFLDLSVSEENEILELKLKSALAKYDFAKNITMNTTTKAFNRLLNPSEIEILTYGLLVEWLMPRVYNIEILETRLASNEFKTYSAANHLSELRALLNDARIQFENLKTKSSFIIRAKERME